MPKVVRKSVVQRREETSPYLSRLMESFRRMVNDCIRIGLDWNVSSLRQLSSLSYQELRGRYDDIPSYYALCAASKAAGILSARKKSIKRGYPTKKPYVSRPLVVSCYGFKVGDGSLLVPLGERRFERIELDAHTLAEISRPGVKVRSFTLTEGRLSLCISKELDEKVHANDIVGIDRNLGNVAVGNPEHVTYYDVSKTVEIGENTRSILSSFKRNDARIRKKIAGKYGQRRKDRVRQILNRVSRDIVEEAKRKRQAIAFEDVRGIRKVYRRGNGQGRSSRGRMNSWPFHELKRQVEYKAAWEGVPVVTLSPKETRGTTMDCPRCGERLQLASRNDGEHHRQLWCKDCKRWTDRDLVAVLNISRRGWVRFAQSKDEVGEAVRGNPKTGGAPQEPVILRVDASKPILRRQLAKG